MLAARAVTAAILLAACVAALFLLPNLWWSAALLAVLLLAAWEWGALAGYGPRARWLLCGVVLASAIALYWAAASAVAIFAGGGLEQVVYAAGAAFWVLIAPGWLRFRWQPRGRLLMGAAGLVVLLPAWLALARLQADPAALLQILGVIWVADTAAYAVGRRWGRHKLAPTISPGKTWEGVGGAAAAVAVYYGLLSASGWASSWAHGWSGGLLVACVAAISIVGDLLESWVKRRAGVKDSGALLPGHGGILDRIDGVMAGMPIAALFLKYGS